MASVYGASAVPFLTYAPSVKKIESNFPRPTIFAPKVGKNGSWSWNRIGKKTVVVVQGEVQ